MSPWKRALGFCAGLLLVLQITFVARAWYKTRPKRAEVTLHGDLSIMREAIQQFTLDKQAAPQSLNDLVSAGYLRDVPADPITHSENWNVTSDHGGVIDVHSNSQAVSPFEHTAYSTW